MKYYHLIGFSVLLTGLQFTLQTVFGLELSGLVTKLFLGTQTLLLVGYSLLFFVFLMKKKKSWNKEEKHNVVPIKKHQQKSSSYSKAS